MFSWLGDVVGQFIRSDLDNLKKAWSDVKDEYGQLMEQPDLLDNPQALAQSNLGNCLGALMEAIIESDRNTSKDVTGPCFEFILQENLIDNLCSLGLSDTPAGMRSLIAKCLSHLFSQLRQPLLPNMSVHLAVRQFISVCYRRGDLKSSKSKKPFLQLIHTIALKLRLDPSLAWVLVEEHPDEKKSEFVMFEALCSLLNDYNHLTESYMESLLCCVQLPDEIISNYIANSSFPDLLIAGLCELHEKLPVMDGNAEKKTSEEEFSLLWNRLKLIDVVCESTYPRLAEKVATVFRTQFLESLLKPAFVSMEEQILIWATVYLRKFVEQANAPLMQKQLIMFLLSNESVDSKPSLQSQLIKRIDSLSPDITSATISLFDALFSLRHPLVFHELLLKYLPADNSQQCYTRVTDIVGLFKTLDYIPIDSSFESYLVEAQIEAQKWVLTSELWENFEFSQEEKTDSLGLFIDTFFVRLEAFFQNPFSVNLALTSLLSHIAHCNHPTVHSFVFGTHEKSLISFLKKLWQTGLEKAGAMPDYAKRLQQTKEMINEGRNPTEAMDNATFLQGMIVLEEFVKEVVAILQAHNQTQAILEVAQKSAKSTRELLQQFHCLCVFVLCSFSITNLVEQVQPPRQIKKKKMARFLFVLFAFAFALQCVRAEDSEDRNVIVLTDDNFDSIVNQEETMLVVFYAPWCQHSQKLLPEFSAAATEILDFKYPVKFGKIDATQNHFTFERMKVTGYPTMKYFRFGKPHSFVAQRNTQSILTEIKKVAGPSSFPLDSVKEAEKLADTPFFVFGCFHELVSKTKSAFLVAAEKLREDYPFYKSTSNQVCKLFGIEEDQDAIVAVRPNNDIVHFSGDSTSADVEKFVTDNVFALVGWVTPAMLPLYRKQSKPLVKLFVPHPLNSKNVPNLQYYTNRLQKFAEQYRGQLLFGLANPAENRDQISALQLEDFETPIVIEKSADDYVLEENFSVESTAKFLEKFIQGKARKFVKSDPVPKTQGPVVRVVGRTWEDIVMDRSKNVFIMLETPWCGLCKAAEPELEHLARKLSDNPHIVIAKIDVTTNYYLKDQFPEASPPTIYLKLAGEPYTIPYDGPIEVRKMKKFIKKNMIKPAKEEL